jgi:uncharacterized iron-regulated membrane protein
MRTVVRRVVFWAHLAAGVAIALPILVMCVSGVLMMYEAQTEAWMDRWGVESHAPTPGAPALEIETLIGKAREARGVDPELITVFPSPTQPVEASDRKIGSIYLDAYSGAVIGERSRKTRQFFRKVKAWHVSLGVKGPHARQSRELAAAANMGVLFLAISGICLWYRRGIALPCWGVMGRARDFNWHNSIGIWSVIPILTIAWTGAALSYGWASQLTYRIMGTSAPRAAVPGLEIGMPAAESSSLDALLSRAKRQSPDWKAITMEVPRDDTSTVDFAIDSSGYNGIGKSSTLELDRTGRMVFFAPAGSDGIAASTFIRYGHTGETWGVAGQTIAGAASLGAAVLVWTGMALSLRRLRSRLARHHRLRSV